MTEWVKFTERAPEVGDRVLITFIGDHHRVGVCYYDSVQTWCDRLDREWEEDFRDPSPPTWFTEAGDPDDWWEAAACYCWAPISAPPR